MTAMSIWLTNVICTAALCSAERRACIARLHSADQTFESDRMLGMVIQWAFIVGCMNLSLECVVVELREGGCLGVYNMSLSLGLGWFVFLFAPREERKFAQIFYFAWESGPKLIFKLVYMLFYSNEAKLLAKPGLFVVAFCWSWWVSCGPSWSFL